MYLKEHQGDTKELNDKIVTILFKTYAWKQNENSMNTEENRWKQIKTDEKVFYP